MVDTTYDGITTDNPIGTGTVTPKRPKVGILSMQRVANYGSFLQAYALRKMLEDAGADVTFVDYHPGRMIGDGGSRNAKDKITELLGTHAGISDMASYVRLKRWWGTRILPTLGIANERVYSPQLDMLVLGSDEIWNCTQPNPSVGLAPELFGQGSRANRVVSYAASFGSTTMDALRDGGVDEEIAGWLGELDATSARDANTAGIVTQLTGREPITHLDPVLAYDFDRCPIVPADSPISGDYVVAYGYTGRFSTEECEATRRWADAHGFKVVCLGGVQACGDETPALDPFETVAVFRHAMAVVTDTFHGTILAAITHRPFVTMVRTEGYANSQKLTDLLERLGLSNRTVRNPSDIVRLLSESVRWDECDKAIARGRVEATTYLREQVRLATASAGRRTSYLDDLRRRDCCGCGACASVCPTEAITMGEDTCGFALPRVDASRCIGCDACTRVCPIGNERTLHNDASDVALAARMTDEKALGRSASGGVAFALETVAIRKGGVVYACITDEGRPRHARITNEDELAHTQGSCYAQSDTTDIWDAIKGDVKAERKVLFVGTPCQCAAARMVTSDNPLLSTVEIVCEGVPSATMYESFLQSLEPMVLEPVSYVRFRDKERDGWSTGWPAIVGNNGQTAGEKRYNATELWYYDLFKHGLILRDSCHDCPFATSERVADVTIGDLWGIETMPVSKQLRKTANKGTSCVLVNTERGRTIIDAAAGMVDAEIVPIDTVRMGNSCLLKPSSCNQSARERMLMSYANGGADGIRAEWEHSRNGADKTKNAVSAILSGDVKRGMRSIVARIQGKRSE